MNLLSWQQVSLFYCNILRFKDGLWDVITDQVACNLAREAGNSQEAAASLVENALQRFVQLFFDHIMYFRGSTDNITVLVVRLLWNLDFITQDEAVMDPSLDIMEKLSRVKSDTSLRYVTPDLDSLIRNIDTAS